MTFSTFDLYLLGFYYAAIVWFKWSWSATRFAKCTRAYGNFRIFKYSRSFRVRFALPCWKIPKQSKDQRGGRLSMQIQFKSPRPTRFRTNMQIYTIPHEILTSNMNMKVNVSAIEWVSVLYPILQYNGI